MLSAFHEDEVQVNMMALLEMPIFTDIADKKKVEKICPCVFQKSEFWMLEFPM